MSAARFLVSGKVQGVFFRASTRQQALRLRLRGHAKNLANGDVEIIAFGDSAAVDQLEAWLHHGPPDARVERLLRDDIEHADEEGFRVL